LRDGKNNCFSDISDISADAATSKILTDSHLDLASEDISAGKPECLLQKSHQHFERLSLDLNMHQALYNESLKWASQ